MGQRKTVLKEKRVQGGVFSTKTGNWDIFISKVHFFSSFILMQSVKVILKIASLPFKHELLVKMFKQATFWDTKSLFETLILTFCTKFGSKKNIRFWRIFGFFWIFFWISKEKVLDRIPGYRRTVFKVEWLYFQKNHIIFKKIISFERNNQ